MTPVTHQRRRTASLALAALGSLTLALACRDLTQPKPRAVPGPPPSRLLNPAGVVVVSPLNMRSWVFYDDQHDTVCTVASVCSLVSGPDSMPIGTGSAELATQTTADGKALLLPDYRGTRFDQITALSYSTYRQSVDSGGNLAIALQFNVDYDLTDAANSYQGRIVFEPYRTNGGHVLQHTWQTWDARAGSWWGTKTSVFKAGVATPNPCVQASPCSWSQLLSLFPDIGVHSSLGAVVLKAGSGWPAFRGNVDKLTIGVGGATTTFDFEATEPPVVPPVSPDVLPDSLFSALGVLQPPNGHFPMVRSIVKVTFTDGAPQPARQSAIAAVQGTVVGGFLIDDDGNYYVRIPDTTYTGLQSAITRLDSLSQVAFAFPMFVDTLPIVDYRKPYDGPGWRDWKVNPDAADGSRANWNLEAINAPMAWGCSIGDTATTIAVVDAGIGRAPTFARNIGPHTRIWFGTPITGTTEDHGTRVAEMLASTGGDSLYDTGVMWRAKMDLWDYLRDPVDSTRPAPVYHSILGQYYDASSTVARLVSLAGRAGARVINLSAGLRWPDDPPSDNNLNNVQRREDFRSSLEGEIDRLDRTSNGAGGFFHPLIVISAGNDSLPDAKWSGFTEVKTKFSDQVIVVGESMPDGTTSPTTNKGTIVDLYAPTWFVNTFGLDATGGPDIDFGTSFGAALVSGTAGLLTGFDPRLSGSADPRVTTPLLKSYILAGARTSAAGLKVLDAYGALRVAAQQPGAPLCGNRIWVEGDNVRVQRTPTLTETIASGVTGSAFVSAYHGGKRVDLDFSREFTWSNGSWTEARSYSPVPDTAQGGAFWSYNEADHDDRQFVSGRIARDAGTTGNDTVTVTFTDSLGAAHTFTQLFAVARPPTQCVATKATFDNNNNYTGNVCVNSRRTGAWDDIESVGQNGSNALFPVLAPQADFILLPVATMHRAVTVTSTVNCDAGSYPPGIHDTCDAGTFSDSSISLVVYKIKIADGSWTPIALNQDGSTSRDRGYYEWLEVSELGDQVVIGAGEHVRSGSITWGLTGSESRVSSRFVCRNGHDQWLSLALSSGSPPGFQLFDVPRPDPDPCAGDFEAGGTVAPIRIPLPHTSFGPNRGGRGSSPGMKP